VLLRGDAGDLDHGALRREGAAQDREAAVGVDRPVERVHHLAVGGGDVHRLELLAIVRPVTVRQSPWSSPASSSSLSTTGTPPMRSRSLMK
jgi:hypothetical protein